MTENMPKTLILITNLIAKASYNEILNKRNRKGKIREAKPRYVHVYKYMSSFKNERQRKDF